MFIQRCLDLAIAGSGKVSPNPMVGCIITDAQGHILSEGFHEYYGGPHAEVNAFAHFLGELPQGARLYVSLEPCNHYGKTPPCTDRIIASGIREVYIADVDPNPLVSGKGIERLKAAGIEVKSGILSQQAAELNRKFYTQHIKNRPYYTLKWAQTANGKIGKERYLNNDERIISSESSHIFAHKLRTESDAILVGINTILSDNPRLNARLWPGKSPVILVIDPDNRTPVNSAIFQGEETILIFNKHLDSLDGTTHRIKIDFNLWPQQLNHYLLEHKIQSVLVEGGAKTLQSFIDAGLWDECYIFHSQEVKSWNINAPELSGHIITKTEIGKDILTVLRPLH